MDFRSWTALTRRAHTWLLIARSIVQATPLGGHDVLGRSMRCPGCPSTYRFPEIRHRLRRGEGRPSIGQPSDDLRGAVLRFVSETITLSAFRHSERMSLAQLQDAVYWLSHTDVHHSPPFYLG